MGNDGGSTAAGNRARTAAIVLGAGAIGAALNAGVIVSTFLPGAPHLPPAVTTGLWLTTLPILFGAVLLVENTGIAGFWRSRGDQGRLLARLPRAARLIADGTFLAGWLIGMIAMLTGPSGVPEVIDGRYALNNHGEISYVSESTYTQALLAEIRIFAGIGMALQAGGAARAAAIRADPDRRPRR